MEQGPEAPAGHRLMLPYVFSTETLGIGLGLVATYGPASSPESLYYSTAFMTDNGSALGLLGGNHIRLPGVDRLFISAYGSAAYYTHLRVYVDGNPDYPGEQAGSNDSSAGNYIEEEAVDLLADIRFEYILPIGHFKESAIHTYVTRNGILEENPSGASSWNPLASGRSRVGLKPYYRQQFTDVGTDEYYETLYFEIELEHDNRDFIPNPHKGFLWSAAVRHDPQWVDGAVRWTVAEGEMNGYIPLPSVPGFIRQHTLALSGWCSDTLSRQKAPYFAGPSLGGLDRLRGYPSHRFHDKAAVHYALEYRIMPEWQTLSDIRSLDLLKIRWWQIVGLIEAGRVSSGWNTQLFTEDLKVDAGVGLRFMLDKSVGRLDVVASEEGFSAIVMIGQAF